MNIKKIFIVIPILVLIFFLSISALCSQCDLSDIEVEEDQYGEGVSTAGEEPGEEVSEEEEEVKKEEYYIAYFEVGIDENSMHFEHRVANIYAVSPDGNDRRLVFTDLNEKYDLGRIYSISPDGSRISCEFFEGGRGAYSALRVIDINTGEVTTAVEFDYTETESKELMANIYEDPTWSHDGGKIAFEIVSNPYSDNFSYEGISIVDIDTGNIQDVDLNIEGNSVGSTTFTSPVLFSQDDSGLFCILHTFYPKEEDGAILNYFSRNEKLLIVYISSGEVNTILDINQFKNGEMSFDNFNLFTQQDRLVFQVVGDFEEDGDIWVSDSDGNNLFKLTENPDLREQQPSILDMPDTVGKLAYTGVKRYGTISSQLNSGDIYIINIDGSGQDRITDYGIGAAKPVFSPDGKYLAFIRYIYDNNMEYVESSQIEVCDMESGEIKIVASGSNIFDLIGWIKVEG